MFLYVLLQIITVLDVIWIAALFLFGSVSENRRRLSVVMAIAVMLLIPLFAGKIHIEEANTITETSVVQTEISKMDISESESSNPHCYITAGKYVLQVTEEEYASLNVGDVVTIEIVTKTVLGEESKPSVTLK